MAEQLDLLETIPSKLPVAPRETESSSIAQRLRELVLFEMPVHLALTTRRLAGPPPSESYTRAMQAYRSGRHATARRLLTRASQQQDRSQGLSFYLGV